MKKRIFWSICLTTLAGVLLVAGCVVAVVYNQLDKAAWAALQTQSAYLAEGVQQAGEGYLAAVPGTENRITYVDANGDVLFDSATGAELENHAGRPEIAGALADGTGSDERESATLGMRTLYYATRLADGTVLRVATTVDTIWSETLRFVPWLCALALAAVLVAVLVAQRLTRAIVEPINSIDLAKPLETEAYGELSPLLRRIAKQNTQIQQQLETLHEKQLEFNTVTENMDEGLVVLAQDSSVLSINSSAQHILGVSGDALGLHILELSRDLVLDKAVKRSLGGHKDEYILPIGERKYRLLASPSLQNGDVGGAVLLLVDETERLEAENLRREFSANVSHELKTPLTSISGYAEIMQNGLVKPADIHEFAGRIYEEANRLIALVGDIIKLSKLDERETAFAQENVELLGLAQQTAAELKDAADAKQVQLRVTGNPVPVQGVRSVLGEVLYNLLDNAIKYNREGGEVVVTVWQQDDAANIRVADTGLGIAPDQQARVFERFYRGDTSHSSAEISGTGLGLSIVKRGVLYHGGAISLDSMPGRGSTFHITLPVTEPS